MAKNREEDMKKAFVETATLRADNNELQTQLTLAQAQIN